MPDRIIKRGCGNLFVLHYRGLKIQADEINEPGFNDSPDRVRPRPIGINFYFQANALS